MKIFGPSTDGLAVVFSNQEDSIDVPNEETRSHPKNELESNVPKTEVPSRHAADRPLSEAVRDGLESVLAGWTVPEVRQVLSEIDRRFAVTEVIRRLAQDPDTCERTLHELVLNALWLFGPEYESATYCSNATLRTIAVQLFGHAGARFPNERDRPDIVMTSEGHTCALACVEARTQDLFLCTSPRRFVLVELKKGAAILTRRDLSQADGYAQVLGESGVVPESCFVNVFVIGGSVGAGVSAERFLSNGQRCYARVKATTYGALASAGRRYLPMHLQHEARLRNKSTDDLWRRLGAGAWREHG